MVPVLFRTLSALRADTLDAEFHQVVEVVVDGASGDASESGDVGYVEILTPFARERDEDAGSRGGAEQVQKSTALGVGGVIVDGCEDAHGYRDRRIEIPQMLLLNDTCAVSRL